MSSKKEKDESLLYCRKCGLKFRPKHPNNMEQAEKQLRSHEQNCRNTQFIHNTESVTDEHGHHVTRSWTTQ